MEESNVRISSFGYQLMLGRCIVHELGREIGQSHDKQHVPRLTRGNYAADFFFFQLTFYEIYNSEDQADKEVPWRRWKTGKLQSDGIEGSKGSEKTARILVESSYSIQGLAEIEDKSGKAVEYWTLLELRPFSFAYLESNSFRFEDTCVMLAGAVMHLYQALYHITRAWNEILTYFGNLIKERAAFLDLGLHDTLLVDDEEFSRSKRYFWAISTLQELDISITENMSQVEKFVRTNQDSANFKDSQTSDWAKYVRSIGTQLMELKNIAKRLQEKKDEVLYLRDGLFNASGVIESRTSTRLNENVRLLTFASIFFLPLSFCMSIWSINTDLFELSTLAIVAACVGLATYSTVFNLDNLMHKYQSFRVKFVKNTVQRMKQEDRGIWKDRAIKFEKFINAKEADHRPSDWLIIQYRVRKLIPSVQRG
ncbi:hypothetical protein EAF04_006541 [Stromatinia cepivora]|nr:hypothetical protein EAF04_006541 [Stromatinia cepivora]